MPFTAGSKRNLSLVSTSGWFIVASFWLFGPSEPIGKWPRASVEGRLAGYSCNEQRALADSAPAPLMERSSNLRGEGEGTTSSPEAGSKSRRQRALMALASGRFDDAIVYLEAAVELSPDAADLESDLAAVLLSRGRAQSDPYDYFLALKAAQRALHIDPTLLPALFNRALALTQIQLLSAAEEAWAIYLQAERDPGWLAEAERARFRIPQAQDTDENLRNAFDAAADRGDRQGMSSTVLRSPRLFREHAEEVLLVAWGAAVLRGDELGASRSLKGVRWIGDALATLHQDSTLIRTVAHIEQCRDRASENFALIAAGLEAYGQGLALVANEDVDAALEPFSRAEKALSQAGSPFASWARFRVALSLYHRFDYDSAKELLATLAPIARADRQWAIHGRAMSLLALIEVIEGDPAAALGHFKAAERSFSALSELTYQAKQQAFVAICFDYLGQRREAWLWLHSALAIEGSRGSVDEGTVSNLAGAQLALEEDAVETALLFQEVVLRAAQKMSNSAAIAEALRGRAGILEFLGRIEDAQQDLRAARTELRSIGKQTMAKGIEGDLALIEARIARDRSPVQALELFDQAIEVFRSTSYWYSLVLTLMERARLLISLEKPALAARDLADAIAESERQRLSIDMPSQRASYFDQIRALLDTMVDLQIRLLDRPQAALEYSERAKARVLWDWLKIQQAPQELDPGVEAALAPARVEDWQCELPAGSLAVEYAVLPDRLVIWSMEDCTRTRATTVEVAAEPLEALVREFREAILERRGKRSAELAAELYELLIRPFEKHVAPGQPLVLIPDGPLHELPFSLLQDAATRRRLIEDHAVSLAPSLRILAASLQRDRELARDRAPRALIVTAPKAAPQFALRRLESGAVEASIADFFPGSLVLPGKKATKVAFLSASRELEILHFGGHSVVNTEAPLLSRMFFSPDSQDPSGVLYSRDLLKQRFPAARLAVLASCESGLGKLSRTEGVESLARPFLAIGVPGVIASLWRVEDEATAEFFVLFYSKLAKTWNVAEALRETQVELLERDPTGSAAFKFGAFVFIGTSFTQ